MASFRKRLGAVSSARLPGRTHFFAVAAQLMRRILMDAARARGSVNRGGLARRVEHSTAFDPDEVAGGGRSAERIALDHALDALAKVGPRKTRVIELRFFGGLSPGDCGCPGSLATKRPAGLESRKGVTGARDEQRPGRVASRCSLPTFLGGSRTLAVI
jgi:ECF sigma factor